TVFTCSTEAPFWIKVDGLLRFATDRSTCLENESLFIGHTGKLEVGTAAAPIDAAFTATLTARALSGQPIDHAYDAIELSRGIVAEGLIEMAHATKRTPIVSVKQIPPVGSSQLVLDGPVEGWTAGDALVYTSALYDLEEEFTLKAIDGQTVTLDHPIKNARKYPSDCQFADCRLHLANRTRGIVVRSAPGVAVPLQGHLMMMMSGGHSFTNVAVTNLGRTTVKPVTDPLVGEDGSRNPQLMPLCGVTSENIRGRYPFHFHNPKNQGTAFSNASGVAIYQTKNSGIKFGYIVHSSNVNLTDTLAINSDGSSYMTEEGDEQGTWSNITAIHSKGNMQGGVDHQPSDQCVQQYYPTIFNMRRLEVGFQGAGLWLQGGGVRVDGFLCAGMFSTCTDIWTRPLDFRRLNTFRVMFPVKLLPGGGSWVLPTLANIGVDFVPSDVRNGTAYGVGVQRYAQKSCFSFKYHTMKNRQTYAQSPRGVLANVLGWNCHNALATAYSGDIDISNVTVIRGDV